MKMRIFYKKILALVLIICMTVPEISLEVSAANTGIVFEDISESQWYAEAVRYVYNHELMSGLKNTIFGPSEPVSREMFVTILGRMDKVDQNDFRESSFKDVETGLWYSAYVEWAVQNKIVSGYNEDIFGTNDSITHQSNH